MKNIVKKVGELYIEESTTNTNTKQFYIIAENKRYYNVYSICDTLEQAIRALQEVFQMRTGRELTI